MNQNELKGLSVDLCGNWLFGWSDSGLLIKSKREAEESEVKLYDCTVPGNFEVDLEKAGKVPNVFFGMNPVKVNEFVEKKHVYYILEFTVPEYDGRPVLIFEGIDCFSNIYVNGNFAAATYNMLRA